MVDAADETRIYNQVLASLGTFLGKVKDLVLAGFRRFGSSPDPNASFAATPLWTTLVDKLMASLKEISESSVPEGLSVASNEWLTFQQQITRNLLARIPDEIHALIVEQIEAGKAASETQAQIAARIDQVLSTTASERWPNRARLIAVTEVHKASNLAIQAAGQTLQAHQSGTIMKTWDALSDEKVREPHRIVDGTTIPINQKFMVNGIPMIAPGDPSAPPDLVCNCRCSLKLEGVKP